MVHNWWMIWSCFVITRLRFVINRFRFVVNRLRFVVNRGRGMIWFRWMVWFRCMVWFWCMIGCWCMVWSWCMVRNCCRGMNSYDRFFISTVSMKRVWRDCRLTGYMGLVSSVGLVDRHMDCGGRTLLERLVVGLVPGDHGSTQ